MRFRKVARGALALDVRRCALRDGAPFRLELLFEKGTCTFGSPSDLARFWNSTIADAFGLPRGAVSTTPDGVVFVGASGWPGAGAEPVTSRPAMREHKEIKSARLTPSALARRLEKRIEGQPAALEAVASLVAAHLSKRFPRRPATALLIGPPGVGKTRTAEALTHALRELGRREMHLYRMNCNELTNDGDGHRIFGSPPGFVGFEEEPPLLQAIQKPGCVILLDEFDRADRAVQTSLYGLLESGRLMAPNAAEVNAPHVVVLMTSNAGADELMSSLHRVAPGNHGAIDRIARGHLTSCGWREELVSRIDTIAVFRPLDRSDSSRVADGVIRELAEEFGFSLRRVPRPIRATVLDMAFESNARSVYYAARRLLGAAFADAVASGLGGAVVLEVGPPPKVCSIGRSRGA